MQIDVSGKQGQVLVNPVLLDFGKNPLALDVRGTLKGDVFAVDSLRLLQTDLIELTGSGSVNLAGEVPVVDGDFRLAKFEFPAAYSSYMQITLATTSVLSDLKSSGSLSGELSVRGNGITALHVAPKELELHDNKGRLDLSKVNGDVYWNPADSAQPRGSKLAWAGGGAYGLSGGAAELEFLLKGTELRTHAPHQTTRVRRRDRDRHFRDRQSRREQHGSGVQGKRRADQHAAAGQGIRLAGVLRNTGREHSRRHAQGQPARLPGQRRIAGIRRAHRRQQYPAQGSAGAIPGIFRGCART